MKSKLLMNTKIHSTKFIISHLNAKIYSAKRIECYPNAKIKYTKFALLNFAKLIIIEPFSRKNLFFGNFYLRKLVPLRQLRNIEYIAFLIFFSYSQKNRKTELKISLKCQQMKIKSYQQPELIFSPTSTHSNISKPIIPISMLLLSSLLYIFLS